MRVGKMQQQVMMCLPLKTAGVSHTWNPQKRGKRAKLYRHHLIVTHRGWHASAIEHTVKDTFKSLNASK